eukprot:472532-Pleurochrysis_carterae.AAC.1
MSSSPQRSSAAAARRAARSSWRRPGKWVLRVERSTWVHLWGSAQSHTTPLAHSAISSCSITTVGTSETSTSSPAALRLSAAIAASA